VLRKIVIVSSEPSWSRLAMLARTVPGSASARMPKKMATEE
jgi:hypothetical protein